MAAANDLETLLAPAFAIAGFELFLVGGALRDELLGREHLDVDFATSAHPEQTAEVLEEIPGASVYRVGEKFGTIGVALGGRSAEVTTYRSKESYATGSRKPAVEFGTGIEEDLSRRDFTINAMARVAQGIEGANIGASGRTPADGIIDPFGGAADIRDRIVRCVGDANERFQEDPLRLLRGIRFASDLGFSIEESTLRAMKNSASLLADISRERIAQEMNRMLTGSDPTSAFSLLRDTGALAATVPELLVLDTVPDQGPYHAYSLWDHTFGVVEGVDADLTTRWAAILHDVAKPETMSREPDGRVRFFGHEDLGAAKAELILRSLCASNDLTQSVSDLVATHMQLHQYTAEWSDGAVRRLMWRLGENFGRALDLARADARAHGPNPWSASGADELGERARQLGDERTPARSPLTGDELMDRYGRSPGPWIRHVKQALTDLVTDGELEPENKAEAWKAADRLVAETPA